MADTYNTYVQKAFEAKTLIAEALNSVEDSQLKTRMTEWLAAAPRLGLTEGESRTLFENEVFRERYMRSIRFGSGQFFECDCPPKAQLVARDAEGHYTDKAIDAMWFGWQMAHNHHKMLTDPF